MTHCYLRAMSPIHIKCRRFRPLCGRVTQLGSSDLENMGVRASMSVVSALPCCTRELTTQTAIHTVDYGIWTTLGPCNMPFLRSSWNAGFLPSSTDAEVIESIDIQKHRAAELRPTSAHPKTCMFISDFLFMQLLFTLPF